MAFSFNGVTKVITLSTGTTSISVRDMYSRWVDWQATDDNARFLSAFDVIGGDDIDQDAGTIIPIYAFLLNGWRVKPQEAHHTLNVTDGILLVDGGGDPFTNTTGSYIVRVNYQQPVQAISFATGGGGGASYTPDEIAQAVLDTANGVETGLTVRESMRLIAAALAGELSGAATTTVTIKNAIAGDVDRIVATVDEDGNRTSIVTDLD